MDGARIGPHRDIGILERDMKATRTSVWVGRVGVRECTLEGGESSTAKLSFNDRDQSTPIACERASERYLVPREIASTCQHTVYAYE